MQKNDKSYTFLLSHSSKSGIYIKRFSIPKRLVHFGSVGVFLFFCVAILGIGAARVAETTVFAEALVSASAPAIAEPDVKAEAELAAIDQASVDSDAGANSGGPADNALAVSEDPEIDSEGLAGRKASDPANLPTMWAHLGKINNEFGFRRNPFGGRAYEFHPGLDIDGERGEEVIEIGRAS